MPIPAESWIEGPLGIRFGIEDLSQLGADVLGAAFLQNREMLISEALLAHEARFRFTCAHELGHFVLHGKLAVAFRDTTAEPLWRAMLVLIYTTGIRLREPMNLTWSDIDFTSGIVHVTRKSAKAYVQAWTRKDHELTKWGQSGVFRRGRFW